MDSASPFAFLLYQTNQLQKFDIVNIALSCFIPSIEPYRFVISTLGATILGTLLYIGTF